MVRLLLLPAGNQFDSYALTYDLLAPSWCVFQPFWVQQLCRPDYHYMDVGVGEIKAHYTQNGGFVLDELIYNDRNNMLLRWNLDSGSAAQQV